jgi:hypothetical protein
MADGHEMGIVLCWKIRGPRMQTSEVRGNFKCRSSTIWSHVRGEVDIRRL